jgi:hypothetical protein
MFRPFRACINFVASFVGIFVDFVESDRESPREGAKNRNREWTPMHANAQGYEVSGWIKRVD